MKDNKEKKTHVFSAENRKKLSKPTGWSKPDLSTIQEIKSNRQELRGLKKLKPSVDNHLKPNSSFVPIPFTNSVSKSYLNYQMSKNSGSTKGLKTDQTNIGTPSVMSQVHQSPKSKINRVI